MKIFRSKGLNHTSILSKGFRRCDEPSHHYSVRPEFWKNDVFLQKSSKKLHTPQNADAKTIYIKPQFWSLEYFKSIFFWMV